MGGFLHDRLMRGRAIDDLNDEWDEVDRNEIEFAMNTAIEDGLLRGGHDVLEFGADGLEQLYNSEYDTNLDEGIQNSILEILLNYKRENPNRPEMLRDSLIEEVGEETKIVDENVWHLDKSYYVDAQTQWNDAPYHSVEIAEIGRRHIQQR